MPDATTDSVGRIVGQASRESGTLFGSELWWREHYHDIEDQGYVLRPRYHPNWVPSWKKSGKDFFRVEDGQPTLVSVSSIFVMLHRTNLILAPHCDGRDV